MARYFAAITIDTDSVGLDEIKDELGGLLRAANESLEAVGLDIEYGLGRIMEAG
jgi:hypothetical protein